MDFTADYADYADNESRWPAITLSSGPVYEELNFIRVIRVIRGKTRAGTSRQQDQSIELRPGGIHRDRGRSRCIRRD